LTGDSLILWWLYAEIIWNIGKKRLEKCFILGQTGDSAFTNLHIAETTIPNNRIAEATIQNYCITGAAFSNNRIAETIFLNRKFFIELHAEKNFRLMTTFIILGLTLVTLVMRYSPFYTFILLITIISVKK